MDSICGELQRAARKHMEDLAWTNKKREVEYYRLINQSLLHTQLV